MSRMIARWALRLILLFAATRAVFYLIHAYFALSIPIESAALEGKMMLLAWRVQAGLSLYPDWRPYPHVSNFYSPGYFLLVGTIARAIGADLDRLRSIGRAISFGSGLLATWLVGRDLGRRLGPGAGLVGALASLGAMPMLNISTMVRPDMMADTLGVAGFLLARDGPARRVAVGGALLALAALTKQTAAIYLLAAAASHLPAGWRMASALMGGVLGASGLVVAAITAGPEPHFAVSLVGDRHSPIDLVNWASLMSRLGSGAPDLVVFSILGPAIWAFRRPEERGMTALAVAALAAAVATSLKRGAEVNYFVGARLVEAFAVGSLWRAARIGPPSPRIALASLLGAASLIPGLLCTASAARQSMDLVRFLEGREGQSTLRLHRSLYRIAQDPAKRLLTDRDFLEVRQRGRAAFGDPFLFRMQVETGQIRPIWMRDAIRKGSYDLVVTLHDLNEESYKDDPFGLPMVLVQEVRRYYVPAGRFAGYFLYGRRHGGPAAADPPPAR